MSDFEFFEEDLMAPANDGGSDHNADDSDSDDGSTIHYQMVRLIPETLFTLVT